MRIQVTLDSNTGSLTIHAEGCTAATPPARLAATPASIVEATLTEPAMPAQPSSPVDQPPAADQPAGSTADTVRSVAPVADPQPAPTRSTAEALAVPPAVQLTVTEPAATDLAAEVVTEVVATDVPAEDSEQDESLRRTALQLLDDGLGAAREGRLGSGGRRGSHPGEPRLASRSGVVWRDGSGPGSPIRSGSAI